MIYRFTQENKKFICSNKSSDQMCPKCPLSMQNNKGHSLCVDLITRKLQFIDKEINEEIISIIIENKMNI